MLSTIRQFLQVWRFLRLESRERELVFYSEGPDNWPHIGPLVEEVAIRQNRNICYVSSSPEDPGLTLNHLNIRRFLVGSGAARILFFESLDAAVCIMTMPDLDSFYLKRSHHPVHYVYVFHSIVSTHMIYRPQAFDAYDTVFCAGPHHIQEIRATEAKGDLTRKNLVEFGYCRLDQISAEVQEMTTPATDGPMEILIAPSWGEHGLIETMGEKIVGLLLDADFKVTLRPHPKTIQNEGQIVERIRQQYEDHPHFVFDDAIASRESLYRADIMASDWSGAALEYAFGLERPVLFVDTPRKVNNPDYEAIDIEPLEVSIRSALGEIIAPENISEIGGVAERLRGNYLDYRDSIRTAREQYVFNPGRGAEVGGRVLLDFLRDGQAVLDKSS